MLVEVAGRLVGEHQWRAIGERARHRDPLLLAARQLGRTMVEPLTQPQLGQQLGRPGARRIGFGTEDQLRQQDILGGVEIGQQMVELIDKAEHVAAKIGALVIVEARGFLAADQDRAFEPALEQPDRLEQRRLARSRRPEQRNDLPRTNRQVDSAQHLDGDVTLGEAAAQVGGFEDGRRGLAEPYRRRFTHSAAPAPGRSRRLSTPDKASPGTTSPAPSSPG